MRLSPTGLALSLSCICTLFSCTDEVPPISAEEQFTRDFVKEFGVFKAESWSEARSAAITVRTDRPTPVNVFAEIGGERFLFASLGRVNGTQPIIVNVPRTVSEVIVQAGTREYKTALGSVLDLTRGSRAIADLTYSPVTSLDGFQITHEPAKGKAVYQMANVAYQDYLNGNLADGGFRIHQKSNFAYNSGIIYNSSFFYFDTSVSDPWMRIYPLYWKENKYGESDYLLGIYFYNENDPTHIEMHDLEGFDIHDGVVLASDFDSWNVSTGTEAYDPARLKNNGSQPLRMKGTSISFNKNPDREQYPYCIGLYLKSGLKDGYTEGKGRNFTHISFQGIAHNADIWRDNYWDVAFKDCGFAYTAPPAATPTSTPSASPLSPTASTATSATAPTPYSSYRCREEPHAVNHCSARARPSVSIRGISPPKTSAPPTTGTSTTSWSTSTTSPPTSPGHTPTRVRAIPLPTSSAGASSWSHAPQEARCLSISCMRAR